MQVVGENSAPSEAEQVASCGEACCDRSAVHSCGGHAPFVQRAALHSIFSCSDDFTKQFFQRLSK